VRRLAALALAAVLLAALAAAIAPRLRSTSAPPDGGAAGESAAASSGGGAPSASPSSTTLAAGAREARTRAALPRAPLRAAAPGEKVRAAAAALEEATAEGNAALVVARARELRALAAQDPGVLAELAYILLDDGAPLALRQAIAAVLASLGDAGKAVLVDLLRAGAPPELERTVMLALGVDPPDDPEELFVEVGDPWAVHLTPHLVSVVRGPIGDADARHEVLVRLSNAGRPEDRLAAARALRDSADSADARDGLLERVERESDVDTAATAAIGVGAWAVNVPPGSEERARALERLLDALPRADEGVHAALAPSLGEARLSEAEAQRLLEMTRAGDARLRRFATETLMGQLERERARPGDPRVDALGGVLGRDPDPEVRRAAAYTLERAVPDPAAVAALIASLRGDGDADVRAAAARALLRASRSDPAVEALRAAARGDPDEHVRDAAQGSLPVGR
jgi:hypothetical protein